MAVGKRGKIGAAFLGAWRITEAKAWTGDSFEVPDSAKIVFNADGLGYLHFLDVEGEMDCRYGERNRRPLVEFTWLGTDAGAPASGRGWAVIHPDGTLRGGILIHLADASTFSARMARPEELAARRPRGRR